MVYENKHKPCTLEDFKLLKGTEIKQIITIKKVKL